MSSVAHFLDRWHRTIALLGLRLMIFSSADMIGSHWPDHRGFVARTIHPTLTESLVSVAMMLAVVPWRVPKAWQ